MTRSVLERAENAADILRHWAPIVDKEGRFPHESLAALREARLLGLLVPAMYGGDEADHKTLFDVTAILGGACVSTAMIFAMHCSQVAMLRRHVVSPFNDIQQQIALRGALVASVTSETGAPGDVLTAHTPMCHNGDTIYIDRSAPYVSYAAEADYLIVKMKRDAAAAATNVAHVIVGRDDGAIVINGAWNAMGLRGTQTVSVNIKAEISADRVLPVDSRTVALRDLLPTAHLGWAAAWYGAATRALKDVLSSKRQALANCKAAVWPERLSVELAQVRLQLYGLRARASTLATRLDAWAKEGIPVKNYLSVGHRIEVNELKLAASEECLRAIDRLVGLAGLRAGYLTDSPFGLERVLRDVRAAPLMFSNDDLLLVNGALVVVEGTNLERLWQ